MRVFSAILFFLSILSYEVVAEQAIACENCLQAQAEVLVRRNATNAIWCETPNDQYYEKGNRACYSNPKDIYVVNLTTGESYGFSHYHSGQGGEPGYLKLHLQSIAVAPAYQQMLSDFSHSVKSYRQLLQVLANEATLAATNSARVYAASTKANAGSCPANSPVKKAIEAALSAQTKAELQYTIQSGLNSAIASGGFGSVQDAFSQIYITSLGAEFSRDNIGFNVQWERSVGGATKRISYLGDSILPPGPGNEVAWSVSPDERGNITVELNPKQTYIEGLLYSSLMVKGNIGTGSSTPLLSACAKEAFIAALAKSSGTFHNGARGEVMNPAQISSPASYTIGAGGCDIYFYDEDGALLYVFPNMKCE